MWRCADVPRHYYADATWFTDAERLALTGRNSTPYADVVARHYHYLTQADSPNRLMYVDINTYMSDDLLPMTDRMTMGVSLEGRLPFLDYRLVEWALALPSESENTPGGLANISCGRPCGVFCRMKY